MKIFIIKKKTALISLLISVLSLYLYRFFLSDTGVGYLVSAYLVCTLIWMVLGEGFSDVMSRMIRSRLSKGQKTNAGTILSVCLVNQFIAGLLGSVLCCVVTYYSMSDFFGLPKGRFLGFYLGLYFFFRMINEYFYGYASVSSGDRAICITYVLREILRIGSGLLFMKSMYDKGFIAGQILMDEDIKFIYAAAGLFIGFCIAEAFVFFFMFIVRLGLKMKSVGEHDAFSGKDRIGYIFFTLWRRRLGSILHGMFFCLLLFACIMIASDAVSIGISVSMLIIPFAVSAVLSMFCGTSAAINWVGSVRKNEKGSSRAFFDFGIHIVVITAVFFTAFFASGSKLLSKILLSEAGLSLTTELILMLLASIAFVMYWFCDHLCAMRDDRIPRMIADAAAGFAGLLTVRLSSGGHSVYRTLMLSVLIYSIVGMAIWCVITYIRMSMVFDPLRNVLLPIVSGAVTAIALLLITNAAAPHLGNLFTLCLCIPIGLIIYHSVLLLLRNYTEYELKLMPFGGLLYSLGQILKVL